MTYPWAANDVLTASDLNNYAGLILVKSQTIGSGVASVTVTGAFSSTFDNYKIVWNAKGSSNSGIDMTISGATGATDYDSKAFFYYIYVSGGLNEVGYFGGANWRVGWLNGANNGSGVIDIFTPAISGRTRYSATGASYVSSFAAGATVGTTVTSTGFTLILGSGTFSSGTIRVYGYNDG